VDGSGLMRSSEDRVIAGVAGGIAQHFGLDTTLVRVAWALTLLFGGLGALAYVVLWVVLPKGTPVRPAVRIAEERFARGEISSEELQQIRADLSESAR
jgi:phage shock protein PspC (stress-responsive transcriptional regulator)